jgi:hypothetical protein
MKFTDKQWDAIKDLFYTQAYEAPRLDIKDNLACFNASLCDIILRLECLVSVL